MGQTTTKETVPVVNAVSAISSAAPSATSATTGDKPKCKACCACPETKKARDQCVLENGEENCSSFIEAHKKCMRDMGFNI